MIRGEDHWKLVRYLRTPLIDCGGGTVTTHMTYHINDLSHLKIFKDQTIATICVDDLEVAEGAKVLAGLLRDGGHIIVARKFTKEAENEIRKSFQGSIEFFEGFTIIKRLGPGKGLSPVRKKEKAAKRALIIRYGAYGDQIMASSVVDHLYKEGYSITYNCTEKGAAVWKNDPRIDDLMVQQSDIIPGQHLASYYFPKLESWGWDKVVNLTEVVEGDLITVEGQDNYKKPWEWRQVAYGDKNYFDAHMARAGVETKNVRPVIYLTEKEKVWAKRVVEDIKMKTGKSKVFLWNVMGSSFHKVYPWVFDVFKSIRDQGLDIAFVAVGDQMSRFLIGGEYKDICKNMCGTLTFRQSLSLHSAVDGVVTPETWSLSAGLAFPAPVIALLSHSDKRNFSWRPGDLMLHATAKDCSCYPCHQLHYSRRSCPSGRIEKSATLCMDQIHPEQVVEAIKIALKENEDEHDSIDTQDRNQAVP